MTTKQIFVAAIGLCMYISTGLAQDLFQWRGVERSGIYHETGLLKEWPAEGPQLLWHYDGLGLGFTSVTIVNDRIYTTGVSEDKRYVFALELLFLLNGFVWIYLATSLSLKKDLIRDLRNE